MNERESPNGTAKSDAELRSVAALQAALGSEFDIKKMLGEGSMATVYLAKEKGLGRLVAIKVLSPIHAKDETALKRFEREAKSAASLGHASVVQVYRFGCLADETPYLVMPYIKGRTMEERLKAEGQLAVVVAREVLHDIASALASAHAAGIVHRDVRPANVLWDEDTEKALLADFGIAGLLETGGEDVIRLTNPGQMIGNPKYLSPEQLQDQELTELADIYAFGVLGYELFTGDGPYEARTNTDWIMAHLKEDPKDLQQLRPDVGADVADLLRRCLNREPKYRPTAADVVRVLSADSASQGGGGNSGGADAAVDLQELIKRRVPQIVISTLVAGLGLLGLVEMLDEKDKFGEFGSTVFDLTLWFVGAGLAVSTVIAWFHGEKGKQRVTVLEWILLSLIVILWLTASVYSWVSNRMILEQI